MSKLSGLGARLNNASVQVFKVYAFPEQGQAAVTLAFSDGTRLRASYWRLITKGRAELSSFDHQQKYGLPEPIDAKEVLRERLDNQVCVEARMDMETGDLSFTFDGGIRLQVFNFTGYEIWELIFPDGSGEYSNYALEP
jgi:hypothetical protein